MADPLIQAGNTAVQSTQNPNAPVGSDPNAALFSANGQNSTTPPVITPAQGFNNTPVTVPTVTSPDNSSALIGGAKATVDSVTQALTPTPTAEDNQQSSILNDISTLTGQDSGKAQAYLDAQQASGATQANADLTALNNKLKTMTAQYDQWQANLGGNGSVETSAVLAAQNAGLSKARAADIGMVTAQIQAKQGDLKLATNTAHQAVDARYSTIEDNIKTKLAQLQALQPKLDAQQKLQALAQQKILNDQATQVAEEKAQAKENVGLALTAGVSTKFTNKNGQFFDTNTGKPFANPQDFFAAAGVSSFAEAYQKGLVTDVNNQKLQDINFAQQAQAKYPDVKIPANATPEEVQKIIQGSKIYQKDTYIARPAAGGGGSGSTYKAIDVGSVADKNAPNNDWGGLSYNGLFNDAKLFLAENGKMPSLGLGSNKSTQAKRDAIQNYAGQLADAMGMDVTQISAMYKANSKAASDIIGRVAKVEATSGALTSQFPRLAKLAGKVGNLGITESDLSGGKAAAARKFGSVDAGNYIELVQTVRGDYTAMQAALGGGRGGEFFARNAKDAIPLGLTPDQYMGLMDTITQSAAVSAQSTQAEAQKLLGTNGINDKDPLGLGI